MSVALIAFLPLMNVPVAKPSTTGRQPIQTKMLGQKSRKLLQPGRPGCIAGTSALTTPCRIGLISLNMADNKLLQSLVQGDQAMRDTLLAQAATQVDLDTIQVLTQIGPLTRKLLNQAGIEVIEAMLRQFQQANDPLSVRAGTGA